MLEAQAQEDMCNKQPQIDNIDSLLVCFHIMDYIRSDMSFFLCCVWTNTQQHSAKIHNQKFHKFEVIHMESDSNQARDKIR